MKSLACLPAASLAALLLSSTAFAVEFKVAEDSFKQHTYTSMSVAGNFNEWTPGKNKMEKVGTEWKVEIPLEDGNYEYKFVLDTGAELPAWELDPVFPVYTPDGLGGYNSFIAVKEGKRAEPGPEFEKFEWKDDQAQTVSVAGDFDKWEPDYLKLRKGEDGLWQCHIKLERPITYKYVVNGKDWLTEKAADGIELAKDPGGIENNLRPARTAEPVKESADARNADNVESAKQEGEAEAGSEK